MKDLKKILVISKGQYDLNNIDIVHFVGNIYEIHRSGFKKR